MLNKQVDKTKMRSAYQAGHVLAERCTPLADGQICLSTEAGQAEQKKKTKKKKL